MILVIASPPVSFLTSFSYLILDGLLSPLCLHEQMKEEETGARQGAGSH